MCQEKYYKKDGLMDDDKFKKILGKRIRQLRLDNEMTQNDLAKRMGLMT